MRRLLLTLCLACLPLAATADEIGYIEDFSLATDRTKALQQLIPGTEDYYYYHALHYQNTEQFDKVDEVLQAWIKRHNYTQRVREIELRQALLTYPQNAPKSLEFIRNRLGLQFNHQRELLNKKPNLPTALDPKQIGRETLTARANSRSRNLAGFEDAALQWLVTSELNPDRRRHLLERLKRPDHPDLVKLVVDDLNYKYSKGFGSMEIHRQLLPAQLEAALKLKPDLLNQTHFVNAYLSKLRPSDDVDWRHDPAAHEAYLDRQWAFVSRLAPVHNSLKACVLYHRLVLDRSRGIYDKDRFMTYIKLPRNVSYIEPKYMQQEENRRFPANLNANFSDVVLLPPVRQDEPLVQSYLHHFFVKETTWSPYAEYINDLYLKHNFAETKIVNGLGEAEKWYSLLPPAQYQALKERIDLDFAHTNPQVYNPEDPVGLDIYVKNVETLIVKVYEINTENYYRDKRRPIDTDINLDGLVAGEEQSYEYADAPLRRVRRHFDFPKLNRRGVYVIDFIGNGRSSRALVRKGRLRFLEQTTTAGQVFTILDEQNNRLPTATLWMSGHEYKPDKEGFIAVPFSNSPGRQSMVLSHDGFSTLAQYQHQAENYSLTAGIYVDRESLLKRKKAQVLVRPGLYLNGAPVSLKVLEQPTLVITSVDLDGTTTVKEVEDFELHSDRESVYEFSTPDRLSQISFTLKAQVERLSQGGAKAELSAGQQYALNQIDRTDKVEDLHFARAGDTYFVDVLGKTGEARADRPVRFELKHRDFTETVQVTLQSSVRGRVMLGALTDIDWVRATGPEGTQHLWSLREDKHTYYNTVNGQAGELLRIAYMGDQPKPVRDEVSLLELRGNTFVADRFAATAVEDGYLLVNGLPRGEYDLWLKGENQRIRIRLAEGKVRGDRVLGENRILETRGDNPLQIASVETGAEKIAVRLAGATKFARVHVFATRFRPDYNAYGDLSAVRDSEPSWRTTPKAESRYIEGRNIGDEYRYIIDRRYAKKFPGNMLRRPSLLLNPWAVRTTETTTDEGMSGGAFGAGGGGFGGQGGRGGGSAASGADHQSFTDIDFLAQSSAVLVNLKPGDEGLVSIDRAELGVHQQLVIVAVDPITTVARRITLPNVANDFVDLRLHDGLNPEKHYTQQKQVSVVAAKQPFVLADVGAARFESYDSIPRVYSLYATLSQDPKLIEFGFILNWRKMKPEEKREKYSKYSCHELNFYLFKKDPQFFEQVILPYLANKKDKTFMDRWLLGQDLSADTQPWAYGRLNIAERILLSQRVKGEQQHTSRDVADLYDLLPPNIERFNQLFETAIKSSSLDTGDSFGFNAEKDKASGVRELAKSMPAPADDAFGGIGGAFDAPSEAAPALATKPSAGRPADHRPPGKESQSADRRARLESNGRDANEKKRAEEEVLELADEADAEMDFFVEKGEMRKNLKQFYRKLDKTKEWAENNYYNLPIQAQNADLVQVSAFWKDYAAHDPAKPFYSKNLAEAARSFPEMMFALALLDLPLEAPEHKTDFVDAKMTIDAGGPMVVFHEEILPVSEMAEQTPILVSQNFFRNGDRYRHVNGEKLDKYVSDEFLIHVVYGCQVVVTNPTSSKQQLDILLQVPEGAIPVSGGKYTRSIHLDLEPYRTLAVDYYFYFPDAGKYPHYPVHVAKNEELIAHAQPFVLNVVKEPSKIDTQSWAYISQFGSDDEVFDYLKANNLHRTQLDKIAFRMQDKAFFNRVVKLLAARHAYNHTLWSYSIRHNEPAIVREFLQHDDNFVAQCGVYLESPLLDIHPIVRHTYQQLDYRPLVNARAHQFGQHRKILNDRFNSQYHAWLTLLSYKRSMDDADRMATTYYLLLQDRVDEALATFSRVDPQKLTTRMQYDYFAAHLDFFTLDHQRARDIAERYRDYPVDKWRNLFANVINQLDEVEGEPVKIVDPEDRTQQQTDLAAGAASFDFKVESKEIVLNYQGVKKAQVKYYLMDIELLFSRNPFVQRYAGQFAFVRPNLTETVDLPADRTSLKFPLPEALHNSNVLIEISGGGNSQQQAYYSNSLIVQTIENYGQVRVTHAASGKAMPAVYVKVYARMHDGQVKFYKDGYTDLRGRFDYTSLSTNELDNVAKFSLLVLSEDNGAVVREADPPKQ